jgi:serine/threonine protein kinase
VEEYSNKGDILHDMLTYSARYSEAFVAVRVVEPLLQALAYLHEHHIIHR